MIEELEKYPQVNKNRSLLALLNLIRTYTSAQHTTELIHFPELTEKIFTLLNDGSEFDKHLLFSILEKMALTCEQAEEILYLLEASNLLNERLAYKLELQLATEKPESYWRTTQGRKREELIGMLSTSPQAIFNDLPRFQELVNHIVTSQDLTNPASGRIGFELEFISGVPRDRTPKGFKLEVEGSYLEIKVEPLVESQQLKLSYFQRMYNLSLWLEEANAKPLSLHLHLDRKEHPHMPHFSIQSERYYGIDTARPKVHQYQTYEHRGLVVPINQLGNSIDPTALSEIIAMHAEQSKSESDLIGNEKLRFSTENISDIRDLIFGHILIATDNPEVRLAALSALKNPYSLRAFNMFSLMTTCDHQSLIDFAMQSSTDKLSELGFSTKQINQIQMLGLYLEGFNWEMMHSMFKHDSQSFQLFLESLSFPKDQRATNFIIGALEHTELLFKLNPEYTINSSERLLFRIAANNTDPEYIDFLSQLLITGNGIFRSILLNIFSYNQQESSCYLSICKKLLFATDIPDVVCGDVLSSSSSFENTSLLPILESFLTTTSKRSLRVQTVSNIAAFSTSPEAFLILMRFYNLPTTSVREKQNILITIRRKPFGNAAHVATFLKSEMSSDDPRLASTAMLILLETSLDTSQEYLDVAWNQFEGLRYNIVSEILNASSYHPDEATPEELKLLVKGLELPSLPVERKISILILFPNILTVPNIELTLEFFVFQQHLSNEFTTVCLKTLLQHPNVNQVEIFKRALLSGGLMMQQVIPLADELSPENFNLVFILLFSLCDTNMAKYTTSYLTKLAILRNGNDEMITQTMQFVDLSDTIVLGEVIPSLSKNVRSKLSTQLLEKFLEENTSVTSKSAAIGLIEQFTLVHPIDSDWIVDASEHSTIRTLLDFLLNKDTNTQSIVKENLDYITFLHQLIKLDTFGKLWEYFDVCSGQLCYQIMDKLIKIFPDDQRFSQMIISVSKSSDQKLALQAAWLMTESGLPFYKDALLAVSHRFLVTKELSYELDILDFGHIVLRRIGCYLNQFSNKECVAYRNLILESLHDAGYSRARIIASASK